MFFYKFEFIEITAAINMKMQSIFCHFYCFMHSLYLSFSNFAAIQSTEYPQNQQLFTKNMDLKSCAINIVSALTTMMTLIYDKMMSSYDNIAPKEYQIERHEKNPDKQRRNIKYFQGCSFITLLLLFIALLILSSRSHQADPIKQIQATRAVSITIWIARQQITAMVNGSRLNPNPLPHAMPRVSVRSQPLDSRKKTNSSNDGRIRPKEVTIREQVNIIA